MSKTIRRKNSHRVKQWLKDTIFYISKYGGEYQKHFQVEGKERKKRLAEFHSDHYPRSNIGNTPWSFRNVDHRRHRMRMRTALANYWKDAEYVILLPNNPRWDYWD